jgi:hypothetical protein
MRRELTGGEDESMQVGDGGSMVEEADVHEDEWEDEALAATVAKED